MKKTIILFMAFLLITGCGTAYAEAAATDATPAEESAPAAITMGNLLIDMIDACGDTTGEGIARIDADAAAMGDEVAAAVADAWKRVYLDPEYHLFIHGADDPSELPITGRHAIVVLGYALKDGEMTDELRGRCDAAAAVAQAFPDSILVCSGGPTGTNNPDQHTEAGLMKQYLAEHHGIDENRIWTDERALTTAGNAVNTFEILLAQQVETLTIVTSAYHQARGQVLYAAVGAQYNRDYGCHFRIIGNYCSDITNSASDAQTAIMQLGEILALSPEDVQKVTGHMIQGFIPDLSNLTPGFGFTKQE